MNKAEKSRDSDPFLNIELLRGNTGDESGEDGLFKHLHAFDIGQISFSETFEVSKIG